MTFVEGTPTCEECDQATEATNSAKHDDALSEGEHMPTRFEIAATQPAEPDNEPRSKPHQKPIGHVITPHCRRYQEPSRKRSNIITQTTLLSTGHPRSNDDPQPASIPTRELVRPKIQQGKKKSKKKQVKFVNELAMSSETQEAKLPDVGVEALNACAIENYCRFYGLPAGCATLEQVIDTSAGVLGRASYDGPGIAFEQSPM